MPMIEIPPGYWLIAPRGFVEHVAPYSQAFADVADGAAVDFAGLDGADGDDVAGELSQVDGDAWQLDDSTAIESQAVAVTPTHEVLRQYGSADGLSNQADANVAQASAGAPPTSSGTPYGGDYSDSSNGL